MGASRRITSAARLDVTGVAFESGFREAEVAKLAFELSGDHCDRVRELEVELLDPHGVNGLCAEMVSRGVGGVQAFSGS